MFLQEKMSYHFSKQIELMIRSKTNGKVTNNVSCEGIYAVLIRMSTAHWTGAFLI